MEKFFFAWSSATQTLVVCIYCLISISQLCKMRFAWLSICIYKSSLWSHDRKWGKIVKFVSRTSNMPNLGLPGKSKVLLVHKQQPNLQMEANSITLCSVFDIASALHQGWFLITVTSRPWKKHLEMPQACLKGSISKVYPLTWSDRFDLYSHWIGLEIQTKLRWNVM